MNFEDKDQSFVGGLNIFILSKNNEINELKAVNQMQQKEINDLKKNLNNLKLQNEQEINDLKLKYEQEVNDLKAELHHLNQNYSLTIDENITVILYNIWKVVPIMFIPIIIHGLCTRK